MRYKAVLVLLTISILGMAIIAQAQAPPIIGEQTPRLRDLDFSPFEEALADFSAERAAEIHAIVLAATVPDIQAALDAGDVTSEELTLYFISRIQQYDGDLRTYVELNPNALEEAQAADALRAEGTILGPLHGIPVNLKDNVGTTAPMHTTGGAEILFDNVPEEDAPIVTQLREGGAVILGKANLSELAGGIALFPAGYTAIAGQTINPHNPEVSTLGSSSGSGASTAAYLTTVSVGSETAGSLIAPAAMNGVVGMYPTDDLVADEGVIPLVASTDTAGPIARTVTDAAILLSVIDSADVDYTESLDASALEGVTAGLLAADLLSPAVNLQTFDDISDQPEKVNLIAETLTNSGADVVEITLTSPEGLTLSAEQIVAAYGGPAAIGIESADELDEATVLALNDQFTTVAKLNSIYFAPMIAGGVGYDMVGYITDAGAPVTTAQELQAYNNEMPEIRIANGQFQLDGAIPTLEAGLTEELYHQFAEEGQAVAAAVLDQAFEDNGVDIIVSMINEHSSAYALAGYPAITVPLGLRPNGGPTGVTLIGKPGTDAQLLAYAYAFEQASNLRATPTVAQGDIMDVEEDFDETSGDEDMTETDEASAETATDETAESADSEEMTDTEGMDVVCEDLFATVSSQVEINDEHVFQVIEPLDGAESLTLYFITDEGDVVTLSGSAENLLTADIISDNAPEVASDSASQREVEIFAPRSVPFANIEINLSGIGIGAPPEDRAAVLCLNPDVPTDLTLEQRGGGAVLDLRDIDLTELNLTANGDTVVALPNTGQRYDVEIGGSVGYLGVVVEAGADVDLVINGAASVMQMRIEDDANVDVTINELAASVTIDTPDGAPTRITFPGGIIVSNLDVPDSIVDQGDNVLQTEDFATATGPRIDIDVNSRLSAVTIE